MTLVGFHLCQYKLSIRSCFNHFCHFLLSWSFANYVMKKTIFSTPFPSPLVTNFPKEEKICIWILTNSSKTPPPLKRDVVCERPFFSVLECVYTAELQLLKLSMIKRYLATTCEHARQVLWLKTVKNTRKQVNIYWDRT